MSNDPLDQAESVKAKLWLRLTAGGRPAWLKSLWARMDAQGKPSVTVVSDRYEIGLQLPAVIDGVPIDLAVQKPSAVGVGGLSSTAFASAERLLHPSMRK